MGHYVGIRSDDGRLAAMAGERLKLDKFTEISEVCTAPEFRGRGYGLGLVRLLTERMIEAGKIPFLHVKRENRAKALYERVGYQVRRAMFSQCSHVERRSDYHRSLARRRMNRVGTPFLTDSWGQTHPAVCFSALSRRLRSGQSPVKVKVYPRAIGGGTSPVQ